MNGGSEPGLLFDECVDRVLAVPAFGVHRSITFSSDPSPGISDPEVLAIAHRLGLILITEDMGFGRLIFQKALRPPIGLILIGLDPMPRQQRQSYLAARAPGVLAQAIGALVTIGPQRVRSRRFPTP